MTNFAMEYKPSLIERLRRKVGYRYHHGETPEGADALEGWMRTDMKLHFTWADRLRLLVSGRLHVSSIVHTDTPSASICKSRIDWQIKAPGEA